MIQFDELTYFSNRLKPPTRWFITSGQTLHTGNRGGFFTSPKLLGCSLPRRQDFLTWYTICQKLTAKGPETNSKRPWKIINAWKINFLLGWPIFRGDVSFRECKWESHLQNLHFYVFVQRESGYRSAFGSAGQRSSEFFWGEHSWKPNFLRQITAIQKFDIDTKNGHINPKKIIFSKAHHFGSPSEK